MSSARRDSHQTRRSLGLSLLLHWLLWALMLVVAVVVVLVVLLLLPPHSARVHCCLCFQKARRSGARPPPH